MSIRRAIVLFAILGTAVSSYGFEEVNLQGKLTPRTPFDQKLSTAGMLRPLDPGRQDLAKPSIEDLFQTATRFRYARDVQDDRWQTAEETDVRRSGDCEDKAIWLYTKLKEYGYAGVRLVIGKYRPHERNYHVWVKYAESGVEYVLDPAIQKRMWQVDKVSKGFYEPYFSYDGTNRFRHRGFVPAQSK